MILEALQPIEEGEEIKVAYWATEWSMAEPFSCDCGSSECEKTIRGAKGMKDEVLDKHKLNSHIIDLLKVEQEGGKGVCSLS